MVKLRAESVGNVRKKCGRWEEAENVHAGSSEEKVGDGCKLHAFIVALLRHLEAFMRRVVKHCYSPIYLVVCDRRTAI